MQKSNESRRDNPSGSVPRVVWMSLQGKWLSAIELAEMCGQRLA